MKTNYTYEQIEQTLAYRSFNRRSYSKIGKKTALTNVVALAKTLAETDGMESENFETLIAIYAYFADRLPTPKKIKEPFDFVSRSVSTDNQYPELSDVYAHPIDGYIYATDGRRLHGAPTDLTPGYYHAKTKTLIAAIDDHKYPDVHRVIPKDDCYVDTITVNPNTLDADPKTKRCRVESNNGDAYYFNISYLLDALYNCDTLTLRCQSPEKPCRVDYSNGAFAIIMPMRAD